MASGDAGARTGEVFGQRFRIAAVIGEGSMGTVYRAADLRAGGLVALKVLHGPHAQDDRALARFRREAQAAAQLGHDGCVRILDYGVHDGVPFIAMELLHGETLYRLVEREVRLDEYRAVAIAIQLCEVLEAAHQHGIVHRDLKPENIMVLPMDAAGRERIKVLDFGIAKLLPPPADSSQSWDSAAARLTQPGSVLGTPAFMAPEQVRGDAIDDRTDIYIVGILLYEMVTGRLPFASADPVAVMTAQLREQPTPPSQLRPELHPELERAILTCLEKSRAARWPTAGILRQFLQSILPELTGSAEPDGMAPLEPDDDLGQVTEPVDLRFIRQRQAVLRELSSSAPAADHSGRGRRDTAATRLADLRAGLGSGDVRETRPDGPDARAAATTAVRGTLETRVVGGLGELASPAVATLPREVPGATPPGGAARHDDIPTIEVYDDQGHDVEMLISTEVKPRAEIDRLLAGRFGPRMAPPGPTSSTAALGGEPVRSRWPQTLLSEDESTDEADTLEQKRGLARRLVPPARAVADSAVEVDLGEVEVVASARAEARHESSPEFVRLVDDDSLDGPSGLALTRQRALAGGAAPVAAREPPAEPLSSPVDAELRTAVKTAPLPATAPEDELATAIRSPEEAALDLETAIRARADSAQAVAAASAAPAPTDSARGGRAREREIDWDEDLRPTHLMPRSQLSAGLPEHIRRALEVELGRLEDTVDDVSAAEPAGGAGPQPPGPAPAGGPVRTQLLAPPPALVPPAVLAPARPAAERRLAPGPEGARTGSEEDLDLLLRRMPRYRYPVLSTFLAIVVMAAAVTGLLWLIL